MVRSYLETPQIHRDQVFTGFRQLAFIEAAGTLSEEEIGPATWRADREEGAGIACTDLYTQLMTSLAGQNVTGTLITLDLPRQTLGTRSGWKLHVGGGVHPLSEGGSQAMAQGNRAAGGCQGNDSDRLQ